MTTNRPPNTIRRAAVIAAALIFILVAAAAATDFAAVVTRVTDGDTIRVATAAALYTIRLRGIDAPELAQPYGPDARDAAAALTIGKPIIIIPKETDRYGRIVATVQLPDASTLNDRLLDAGLAWWYRHYEPRDRNLRAREVRARAARAGLWAQPFPTPPWQFRRTRKSTK